MHRIHGGGGDDDEDDDDEIDWPAQQCDLSGFCSPATGLRNTWQIYLKDLFECLVSNFELWKLNLNAMFITVFQNAHMSKDLRE